MIFRRCRLIRRWPCWNWLLLPLHYPHLAMFKLLLDENLPKKLKYRFGDGFEITTVPEEGWSSLKNGDLLAAMHQRGIELLVTADKNLSYQQNYRQWNVKLIVLNVADNQYETVLPFVSRIKELFIMASITDYNWVDL